MWSNSSSMGRIILFVIFIISVIAIVYFLRVLWKKFRRTVSDVVDKGSDLAIQQQEKWKQREKRKKLPKEIQNLIIQYEQLLESNNDLSASWLGALKPAYKSLGDIIHILSASPKKMNKVRKLFNTSIPSLDKFVATLKDNQKFMDDSETRKAEENIALISKDLQYYEKVLHQSRRFDFDVLMDVIKIRFKRD